MLLRKLIAQKASFVIFLQMKHWKNCKIFSVNLLHHFCITKRIKCILNVFVRSLKCLGKLLNRFCLVITKQGKLLSENTIHLAHSRRGPSAIRNPEFCGCIGKLFIYLFHFEISSLLTKQNHSCTRSVFAFCKTNQLIINCVLHQHGI